MSVWFVEIQMPEGYWRISSKYYFSWSQANDYMQKLRKEDGGILRVARYDRIPEVV